MMGHFKIFGKSVHVLLGLVMIAVLVACCALSVGLYRDAFSDTAEVTVYSGRTGLLLEEGSDVKFNGVVVGRVRSVSAERDRSRINVAIDSNKMTMIPSNVKAIIDPTTILGRKFIDLEKFGTAISSPLVRGQVISGAETAPEVDDLLSSLTDVLKKISPRQVSDTLNAVATALRGTGDSTGVLIENLNNYLRKFNPLLPKLRRDIALAVPALDRVTGLTPDLLRTVKQLSVTGRTLTSREEQFAAFLIGLGNFGNSGDKLFKAGGEPLQKAMASLRAPLSTVGEFSGVFPCFLGNLAEANRRLELSNGGSDLPGLNIVGTILMGNPPYTYPKNLPEVGLRRVAPSCHDAPAGHAPPHVNFPDGSDAYGPILTPMDLIGNPFADLMQGGSR